MSTISPELRQVLQGCSAEDKSEPVAPAVKAPMGFWQFALAVLVGNLLTGIVAGLFYMMLH